MRSLGAGSFGATAGAAGVRATELGRPTGTRGATGTRGVDAGPAPGEVEGGRPSEGFGAVAEGARAATGTRCTEGAAFGGLGAAVAMRCTEGGGFGAPATPATGFATATRFTDCAVGEMAGRFTPGGERCTCGAAARMTDVEGACSGEEGS